MSHEICNKPCRLEILVRWECSVAGPLALCRLCHLGCAALPNLCRSSCLGLGYLACVLKNNLLCIVRRAETGLMLACIVTQSIRVLNFVLVLWNLGLRCALGRTQITAE